MTETRDVQDLVAASANGDEGAWAELVARYTPLVLAVTRRFELSRADAADVNQTVWLKLVEHLGRLREPAALPMWIATTTRHECIRLQRVSRTTRSFDPLDAAGEAYRAASATTGRSTTTCCGRNACRRCGTGSPRCHRAAAS
jgi:DNA-directed RNA polymerase specialized sigma24 family protein